jgi:hypothetical protein
MMRKGSEKLRRVESLAGNPHSDFIFFVDGEQEEGCLRFRTREIEARFVSGLFAGNLARYYGCLPDRQINVDGTKINIYVCFYKKLALIHEAATAPWPPGEKERRFAASATNTLWKIPASGPAGRRRHGRSLSRQADR